MGENPISIPLAAAFEVTVPADRDADALQMSARSRKREELEASYAALMAEYGPALRRVATSYEADPALQEDLFQEICFAVWRALPRFRGEASARTFVFRIAHNRGLSHGWREGRVPDLLEEPEVVPDQTPSPEARASESQRARQLLTAIHGLPVGLRQVLTLRLEGLSHREIAEITGLTENNVMVRASRARARLKRLMRTESEKRDE